MSENINDLTNEQIDARIAEIIEEFQGLELTVDSPEEDIARGEALADEMQALREENSSREEAYAERSGRLAKISDTLTPPVEAEVEEPVAEAEQAEEEEAEEAVAEAQEPTVEETPVEKAEEAQPIAAAIEKPSPAKRAAAHAPEVKMPKSSSVAVITAAADVPNYASGHQFADLDGAVDAVVSRLRSLPSHNIPNTRLRYGALKFQMQGFGDLVQQAGMEDMELIRMAGDERRLSGGSLALTADAWCAPSETLYDFCSYETVDGLLSVPEFQVTRGGIRYTTGPSLADVSAAGVFHVDNDGEITDSSGTVVAAKPCEDIPCPAFTEVRLEVDGVCIRGDILQNVGYPEVTKRYIELAMIAHAKRMNASNIAAIHGSAGIPVPVEAQQTLLFNLDYIDWYATQMRTANSLSKTASIEALIPEWILPLFRAEIGRRNGYDNVVVQDALLSQWFSVRNIAPQYLRDWQVQAGYPGAIAIPPGFDVVMYPAGTWARGTQGVISLDTVYDSTNLAINKYTALFTEEASLMVQKCLGTIALTIPITVSGLTGAQIVAELGRIEPIIP